MTETPPPTATAADAPANPLVQSPIFPADSPVVRAATVVDHLLAAVTRHVSGGNPAEARVFARELERVLFTLEGELKKL